MRNKSTLPFLMGFMIICFLLFPAGAMADADTPFKKSKQTVLGKYIDAQEAYDRYTQTPDAIKIIDCRTPEEYAYVGHAPMAYNIPCQMGAWDSKTGDIVLKDNPNFEKTVQGRFNKDDLLMLMCRSGSRSSKSVDRLAAIGYTNVYTIVDGFEGDKVKDKRSAYKGKRMRNGWKNALAPWTYDISPELVYREINSAH